jgi:plastocyanin
MSRGPVSRSTVIAVALGALVLGPFAACGPDGPDVYTAPVEDPADDPVADTVDDTTSSIADSGTPEASAPGESIPAESVPANGETVDVRALDNSFIEEELEVAAGTEVHWQNRGRNDHDVVPVDEGAEWGVELEAFTPGDSYSHVFSTPGTYRYYCTVHGTEDVGMIGTIVVN